MTAISFGFNSKSRPDRAQIRRLMENHKVLTYEVASAFRRASPQLARSMPYSSFGHRHEGNDAAVLQDMRQIKLFSAVCPKKKRDYIVPQ